MLLRRDFNRYWTPLLTIFRLFGVTHFFSFSGRITSCRSALCSYLFRFYFLVLCIHFVFLALLVVFNIFSDTVDSLGGFIKRLIFAGELLVYLVTFIESSTTVRMQKDLLDQIFQLNGVLLERFNVDFGMRLFCRKWMWIMCRTIVILFAVIIGPAISFGNEALRMVSLFWIPMMIAQVRVMQMAVFVDCLAEMLSNLLGIVKSEQKREDGDCVIKECMDLYSKLLQMAGTISRTFGWSMLPILGLKICEWINTCYLSMFNTYVERSIKLHTCKFRIIIVVSLKSFFVSDICLTSIPLLLNTHYLFGACHRCYTISKLIPVELHLIPNLQRCSLRSQTIRAFSRQLWNERILITANDFLVLNNRLLAAVI